MTVTADERAALCDLFDSVGPDAPTLCEAWTTRDLLAHLLVRERRPDAAGGILIPALAARTERVMKSVEAGSSYPALIEQLRDGPPMWSPWAIPVLGDRGNTAEFYIHHEDVRRAQHDWEPRPIDAHREEALWKVLHLGARFFYRQSPVGVVLHVTGQRETVAHKGNPAVTLVGQASEIVLHAFGRPSSVTRMVVQGDPKDIVAFEGSPRGL
jgi:uncharacterized protein (TIGR03085 family)